jgi:transposase
MSKPFRPRRDFDGLERRRKVAGRLFAAGRLSQADIARRLQTTTASVCRWHAAWQTGGMAALRKAGRAGRKPRLSKEDLGALDRTLRAGATAAGFSTELWTLPRVAKVIEELSGVRYHPGHVWRILRRLDWTLQRPTRRARERNEKDIRRWVSEDWKRVKKTPEEGEPGSSSKTKAASRSDPPSGGPGRRGV